MEAYDWVLEAKSNAHSSNNMRVVVDKDPTIVLDLGLEEESFKAGSNQIIENDSVPHANYSREGELG